MNDILGAIIPTAVSVLGSPIAGLALKFLMGKLGAEEETVEAVTSTMESLTGTPEGRIRLAEIELQLQQYLIAQGIDLEKLALQNASDVNATMQKETMAEHWPTYSWRPFIGFCVGFNLVMASLIVLVTFVGLVFGSISAAAAVAHLPMVLGALAGLNGTAMPVLGIASWFRGKAQADPTIPFTTQVPFGKKK